MNKVNTRVIRPNSLDFPTFLYDEGTEYNSTFIENGLLRGKLLVRVSTLGQHRYHHLMKNRFIGICLLARARHWSDRLTLRHARQKLSASDNMAVMRKLLRTLLYRYDVANGVSVTNLVLDVFYPVLR